MQLTKLMHPAVLTRTGQDLSANGQQDMRGTLLHSILEGLAVYYMGGVADDDDPEKPYVQHHMQLLFQHMPEPEDIYQQFMSRDAGLPDSCHAHAFNRVLRMLQDMKKHNKADKEFLKRLDSFAKVFGRLAFNHHRVKERATAPAQPRERIDPYKDGLYEVVPVLEEELEFVEEEDKAAKHAAYCEKWNQAKSLHDWVHELSDQSQQTEARREFIDKLSKFASHTIPSDTCNLSGCGINDLSGCLNIPRIMNWDGDRDKDSELLDASFYCGGDSIKTVRKVAPRFIDLTGNPGLKLPESFINMAAGRPSDADRPHHVSSFRGLNQAQIKEAAEPVTIYMDSGRVTMHAGVVTIENGRQTYQWNAWANNRKMPEYAQEFFKVVKR